MKKLTLLLLCLCLLVGCHFQTEPKTSFDTFIDQTTDYFLEGTTSFNLNYLFNHSTYDGKYFGLGFTTEQEYLDTMKGYQNILEELKHYRYKDLNSTQQVVYVALKDYLERQIVLKDYYYYDNDYIGSYSSVIQELPLLLEMYTFLDKNDLEYYFKNIQAFESDFIQAVQFEKKRQEMELGFSKKILDETKRQIQEIIDENGQTIIQSVNHQIDQLDFLTEKEKSEYKVRNKNTIEQHFIKAYQTLLSHLNEIEGQPSNISINDSDYYEAIIYHQLGIKNIHRIEDDLYNMYKENYDTLISLLTMNPSLNQINDFYAIDYTEFESVTEGLDYLKTKIYHIMPEIGELEYAIYTVPESLQEGFAPAAYLSCKVDMLEGQKECIMINPSSPQDNIFPTLVHEGYPGHMYQNTYLRLKKYPILMYLMDCIGYNEGWAIYVENRASEFLKENVAWQKLLIVNDNISSSLLALIDIGIHDKGWTYQDCVDFFNEQTGSNYTSELHELYDIILQTPGYYLYYIYAGEYLHQLYEEAISQLGNNFNEIQFHQVILDSGSVGLEVVKENVNQYIKQNK